MKHALDPKLIATIIFVESGGNHTAVSPRGAKGLMQLTPVVYRQYGVDDPFDIEQNIRVGTAYFAYLLDKFDGNLAHALAAYNCGPTRVMEHHGIPPIRETRDYVKRVWISTRKRNFPRGFKAGSPEHGVNKVPNNEPPRNKRRGIKQNVMPVKTGIYRGFPLSKADRRIALPKNKSHTPSALKKSLAFQHRGMTNSKQASGNCTRSD